MKSSRTSSKNVLIIDDSKADRRVCSRYLAQEVIYQYNIAEADSGHGGLERCNEDQFDVVLLDYQLPDMSGLEVLYHLLRVQSHMSIIMLTGHGDEKVAVQAMKGGAKDYLVKDNLAEEFLQHTVRHAISQTQLQRQLLKREHQQRLITEMGFQIRQSLALDQTLNTLVDKVRMLLQCDRVLAYQFNPDMSGEIIAESVGNGWTSALGQTVTDSFFQDKGAEAYRNGRKQIIADIDVATLDPCHLELLAQFEVKAILVTPVIIATQNSSDGLSQASRLWGLIVAHHCSQAHDWQADEIEMLDALSVHCTIAIQHADLLVQVRTALEKEQALTAFKSQIIATVSHEYNSPIAAIQGAAQVLQQYRHNLDFSRRENLLNIIVSKTRHLSALVKDMLLVHQTENHEYTLKPVSINLADFLLKIIEEQQLTTDQHDLSLQIRGDVNNFWGDRGLLKIVFLNLLSNAIKYSPEGGDVKVELFGDAGQVICTIQDHGIGISDADQQVLFQSFMRGSNVGTIAGTGLGLHIVKTAIKLHQGTITISSQEEEGTLVSISLPTVNYL